MPDMKSGMEDVAFSDGQMFTPVSERPRKLFPETWIWSDLISGFYL